jgi:hypothetical protein
MNTPMRYKTATLIPSPPPRAAARSAQPSEAVAVALTTAILAVRAGDPVVAVVPAQHVREESLPCGPFCPRSHRTLEGGVVAWVRAQTGVEIGFLQQLCALADGAETEPAQPTVSVSYLALVGPGQCSDRTQASWRSWYAFFPWEDWRHGRPDCLGEILSGLHAWASNAGTPCVETVPGERHQRIRMAFGAAGGGWDEEKVLERYELLQEAGLLGPGAADDAATPLPRLVQPLHGDHAAVLARAIGELRRAIKYRPVVFELMPDEFTLFELQRSVEAVLGPHLHKQNFRRMVEGGGLVEPTGEHRLRTGGRPARLYRFRSDVLWERAAPGVRVKGGRA